MSDKRQQMVDTTLMAFADAPSHASDAAGGRESAPSLRKQASFLDSNPRSTVTERMRKLQQERAVLRGFPSKKDWNLICIRKGKGLKVKEEDREKIVAWVQNSSRCHLFSFGAWLTFGSLSNSC